MKKIIYGLFVILCFITLVACNTPEPPKPPVDEPTLEEYEAEVKKYLDEVIPSEVSQNIEFPEYYDYEDGSLAVMEYQTSNGKTLSSKGKYRANLFDEEIIITVSITFTDTYGEESNFSYEKKVNTKGSESLEDYKKTIASFLPDYVWYNYIQINKRRCNYK